MKNDLYEAILLQQIIDNTAQPKVKVIREVVNVSKAAQVISSVFHGLIYTGLVAFAAYCLYVTKIVEHL